MSNEFDKNIDELDEEKDDEEDEDEDEDDDESDDNSGDKDKDKDEAEEEDEKVAELMESYDLTREDAERAKRLIDEQGIEESEAVKMIEEDLD